MLSIAELKNLVKDNLPGSNPRASFLDHRGKWQSSDSSFYIPPEPPQNGSNGVPKPFNLITPDISEEKSCNLKQNIRVMQDKIRINHPEMVFYCRECGYPIKVVCKCKGWRLCELCRAREARRLRRKYLQRVASIPVDQLRLLNLTMPNVDSLDRGVISDIRLSWRRLKQRKPYRDIIRGHLYSIEAPNKGNGWNVHMHIIVWVKMKGYLIGSPQGHHHTEDEAKLSKDWQAVTGGKAKIVRIKNAYSHRGALNYLLKYLSKSPQTNGNGAEYLSALHGCRTLSIGGIWYNNDDLKPEKYLFICPKCLSLNWFSQYQVRNWEWPEFVRGP